MGSRLEGYGVPDTMVGSRSARWSHASTPAALVGARSKSASLVARAQQVAGTASRQARIEVRRSEAARQHGRTMAAAGAVAAAASLVCAAMALVPAVAPDLILHPIDWAVAAIGLLAGLVPAALLAATAIGWPSADEPPASAATSLATLAADFGRAIVPLDLDAQPEIARALSTLLSVMEIEAVAIARSARAQGPEVIPRRHQRIVPEKRRVGIRTADGRRLTGTIADVSLSGVAFTESLPRIAVGDPVTVGTRPAVVARIWERGIAFQFVKELDPATFDESIVL